MVESLTLQHELLIDMAKEKSGNDIGPCSSIGTWEKCFSRYKNRLILWYEDSNKSTGIVWLEVE